MAKIKRKTKKSDVNLNKNTKTNRTQMRDAIKNNTIKDASENKSLSKSCAKENVRKCVVKLRRFHIPNTNTLKDQFIQQLSASTVGVRQNNKNNVKFFTNACDTVIDNVKRLPKQTSSAINSKENISKCVVKINRTTFNRFSKDNSKNSSTSVVSTFAEPVLDEEKRSKLKKLSLCKKVKTIPERPKKTEADISCFDPKRNSTLKNLISEKTIDLTVSANDINNDRKEQNNKHTSKSSHNNSSKNLTNNSDLIEEILLSIDDDEEEDGKNKDEHNKTEHPVVNKTQKFFHRTNDETTLSKPVKAKKSIPRKTNVYEFLSQSQTSGSDNDKPKDPTADVIQKLIEEGKVRVAHRPKGTGKPRVKRQAKPAKKINARKKQAKGKKKVQLIATEKDRIEEGNEDFVDYGDRDIAISPTYELENDNQIVHVQERQDNILHGESTFSGLARSVLMQQTRARRDSNRLRLLTEQARKIVSTPLNQKTSGTSNINTTLATPQLAGALQMTNLSPIQPLSSGRSRFGQNSVRENNQKSCSSPWRAPDDLQLPTVFHFGRGTSNLPSFSSDYIPATPQKSKPYVNKYASIGAENETPLVEAPSSSSNILSSFSSNDSNAENMPPTKSPQLSGRDGSVSNENENIFNARQFPNPRRTLQYRSPLKQINILEVVTLPPWKDTQTSNVNADKAEQNGQTEQNKNNNISIFGFEDYIEEDKSPQSKSNSHADNNSLNNKTIRNKLKELSKWRPKHSEIVINPSNVVTNVFDEPDIQPKQRQIKEMLCSTMINPPKPSLDITQEKAMYNKETRESSFAGVLFKDVDPELTFNEQEPHNTYVRPQKRKRKLRNHFVMFLDSDCSEDDEDNAKSNANKMNSDKNGKNKAKRSRKEHEQENKEVKEFCKSFNEMCKEVEEYQLIVEKSA